MMTANSDSRSRLSRPLRRLLPAALLLASLAARADLSVPAFTAYIVPDPDGARVSQEYGVSEWTDASQKVLWAGDFKHPGQVSCTVALFPPAGADTRLRLTVAGESHEVTVKRGATGRVRADFGTFTIPAAGYQRFTLELPGTNGFGEGNLEALIVDGPASLGAHFNLKERRNTASVHLAYPTQGIENIDAFYCEVTGVETPLWTYFEACGWHRGYFGMQVNSPSERRIIFSVWDSGNEAKDRNKVGADDRTVLLARGDGVNAGDFGNEGTGGHSHLVYNWKTGEKQRFLVTAKTPDATHTIYTGYWFHPEQKKWMLISSWKAPNDGRYLHGLYSFCEDFGAPNGSVQRKALYGNQWYRTSDGKWHEQNTCTFSTDPTGRHDRFDRFMGVEGGQFFLATGGFAPDYTEFGTRFTRPATGRPPLDFVPPQLSER